MNEPGQLTNSRPKSKPPVGSAPLVESPKVTIPHYEMPKMEVPTEVREFAEKSASQVKSAVDDATDLLEKAHATLSKGASEYGLKVIEATRLNTKSTFDFYFELIAAKSLSELIQLTTEQARKQFEAITAQTKELAAIAQKVTTEASEPIKEGFDKHFKKVA